MHWQDVPSTVSYQVILLSGNCGTGQAGEGRQTWARPRGALLLVSPAGVTATLPAGDAPSLGAP